MVQILRRYSSTVSPEGRVVIPAGIRRQLGLESGTVVTFAVEGHAVKMSTRDAALADLQRLFADHPLSSGTRATDELIADRRAEAAAEVGEP